MRVRIVAALVLLATAGTLASQFAVLAQEKAPASASTPPGLRLAATGKPVGFKMTCESSSSASTAGKPADAPRVSNFEMTFALDVGATDDAGALAVGLRIARISGRSTRMGYGSFTFDSEAEPPEDALTRLSVNGYTAFAGAEFALRVRPDGSITEVRGVAEARKLVSARAGAGAKFQVDSWISDESVKSLFLALLGPAPFPADPLTMKSSWTDKDSLGLNSWDTKYEISRVVQPATIAKDTVVLRGKGTAGIGMSSDIALMPFRMASNPKSTESGEWTISLVDGLPVSGTETIAMEATLSAGKDSIAAKHRSTFKVTRIAAPPPPAVRPLAGAQDLERLRQKKIDELRQANAATRKEREADGTRGAWGVSSDGTFVAAGTPSGDVEVWRSDGTRPIAVLKGHTEPIAAIAFTASDAEVYACAADGTVRAWKVADGKETVQLGKPYQVAEMFGSFSDLGYRDVSMSDDGRYSAFLRLSLSVWDTKAGKYLEAAPYSLSPTAAIFHPDARRLVLAGYDELAVYDLTQEPKREPSVLEEGKERVHREPIWKRRSESGAFGAPEESKSLGKGYVLDVTVLDRADLVVALVRESGTASFLRAFDFTTGAKRWEVPTEGTRFAHARRGNYVIVEDATSLRSISVVDGRTARTTPKPPQRPVARILLPDGSAWCVADKDGNLSKIPFEAAPARAPETK